MVGAIAASNTVYYAPNQLQCYHLREESPWPEFHGRGGCCNLSRACCGALPTYLEQPQPQMPSPQRPTSARIWAPLRCRRRPCTFIHRLRTICILPKVSPDEAPSSPSMSHSPL